MSDLENIKQIDVLHASLTPNDKLVDNFWIVDTLLNHIEQLEANAAFYKCCALCGEKPKDGSEPFPPPEDKP